MIKDARYIISLYYSILLFAPKCTFYKFNQINYNVCYTVVCCKLSKILNIKLSNDILL